MLRNCSSGGYTRVNKQNQLEDDFKGDLAECVNSIRESNKMAVRAVQRKLEGE